MARKIGKIILAAVLSFIFFIPAAILLDSFAGMIFGNKSNGDADVNGYVMLAITTALMIGFGVWFYKYVSIKKIDKQ